MEDLSNNQERTLQIPEESSGEKITWTSLPFFVKLTIILSIVVSIFGWTNVQIFSYYDQNPVTFLLSTFCAENFLILIIGLALWIPIANILEKSCGTITYMFNFLLNSVIIMFFNLTLIFRFKHTIEDSRTGRYGEFSEESYGPHLYSFYSAILADIMIFSISNKGGKISPYSIKTPIAIHSYCALVLFTIVIMRFITNLLSYDIVIAIVFSLLYPLLKIFIQLITELLTYLAYKISCIKNIKRFNFVHSESITWEEMNKDSSTYKVIMMLKLSFQIVSQGVQSLPPFNLSRSSQSDANISNTSTQIITTKNDFSNQA
jgi:hypothetical protein